MTTSRLARSSGPETARGDLSIAGSVAVITGGAGGIGRATAVALGCRGAAVVLVDHESERVDAAIHELSAAGMSGEMVAMALDVRSEGDMETMAKQVLARFGRIDVLVCAAGVLRAQRGVPRPLHRLTLDEWRLIVDTNLTGVYLSNRAVLPTMMRQRSGQIINVASTSGLQGRAFDAAYCASKAGVLGLTEAAARETVRYGVRVNAVLPGAVDTGLWRQNGPVVAPPDALPPERIAETIVYLLCMPTDTVLWEPVIVASGVGGHRRVDG
jgi:NAD(P)-dependent dehydrogenase (short-subunit alcohol dehydrogenase family)